MSDFVVEVLKVLAAPIAALAGAFGGIRLTESRVMKREELQR